MNDLIQTIQILSEEEVSDLNKYVDSLEFKKNTVFGKDSSDGKTNTDLRSSTGCTLSDVHPVTQNLHSKMNSALLEYKERLEKIHDIFSYHPVPGGFDTNSWREGVQVLDYVEGQKYNFHHDVADNKERQEYFRTISIIVYLTNDFEGGRTLFPHKAYKPEIGHALMFPSNWCFPHSGEEVSKGKKRVAVTWYYVEKQ